MWDRVPVVPHPLSELRREFGEFPTQLSKGGYTRVKSALTVTVTLERNTISDVESNGRHTVRGLRSHVYTTCMPAMACTERAQPHGTTATTSAVAGGFSTDLFTLR